MRRCATLDKLCCSRTDIAPHNVLLTWQPAVVWESHRRSLQPSRRGDCCPNTNVHIVRNVKMAAVVVPLRL